MIGENGRAPRALRRSLQVLAKTRAIKDIVAQHQCDGARTDKIAADDEGLRNALGFRLEGVGNVEAPVGAVAKQLAIIVDIFR